MRILGMMMGSCGIGMCEEEMSVGRYF
jgi:hypothetical protein